MPTADGSQARPGPADAGGSTVGLGHPRNSDLAAGLAGTLDTASLISLSLNFQGQSFTLAQASTAYAPYAQFDAGSLTGPNALFNTAGGGRLELQSFFGSSNFTYNIAGTDKLGTLTISAVPEPQTYALMPEPPS